MKLRWTVVAVFLACRGGGDGDETGADTGSEAGSDSGSETRGDSTGVDGTSGDETGGGVVQLGGAIQKGPFVVGSTVNVTALDASGQPTGDVFNTMTLNDRGEFDVVVTGADIVDISTQGFYWNEATAALSEAPITLRAVTSPTGATATVYVNVLTHMAATRAKAAIVGGATAEDAVAEAEMAVRDALGYFQPAGIGSATAMNQLGGDNDDNAYLLAVSCSLAEAGVEISMGMAPDAALQELVNTTAMTLETSDTLPEIIADRLAAGRRATNGQHCMQSLQKRLDLLGDVTSVVPNVFRALDFDADGMVDAADADADGDGEDAAGDTVVASSGTTMLDVGGGLWFLGLVDEPDAYCNDGLCLFMPGGRHFVSMVEGHYGTPPSLLADDGTVWRGTTQLPTTGVTIKRLLGNGVTIDGVIDRAIALRDDDTLVILTPDGPESLAALGPAIDAALGTDFNSDVGWIDPDGNGWTAPTDTLVPEALDTGGAPVVDVIGDAGVDYNLWFLDDAGNVWSGYGSMTLTGVEQFLPSRSGRWAWTGTEIIGLQSAGGFEPTAAFDVPLFYNDELGELHVRTADGELGLIRESDPSAIEPILVPR